MLRSSKSSTIPQIPLLSIVLRPVSVRPFCILTVFIMHIINSPYNFSMENCPQDSVVEYSFGSSPLNTVL